MNTTVKKPVGVVGLGAMGMGVAMSLLREGFEVHACDVRPEAVQKVVDAGGIAAASPAAMAPLVDVLITVVVNADQTETVLFGENGAAPHMKPGSVVIASATVSPEFAKALDMATRKHYGCAWLAFLRRLVSEDGSAIANTLHDAQRVFERHYLSGDASGQARRVAGRFALVGAAGELASQWEITGWEAGEAMRAAGACFTAWLANRGGEGNQEERAMLAKVREFLRRYGESAFTDWDRPSMTDTHAPVRSDRAGWRRHDEGADARVRGGRVAAALGELEDARERGVEVSHR